MRIALADAGDAMDDANFEVGAVAVGLCTGLALLFTRRQHLALHTCSLSAAICKSRQGQRRLA